MIHVIAVEFTNFTGNNKLYTVTVSAQIENILEFAGVVSVVVQLNFHFSIAIKITVLAAVVFVACFLAFFGGRYT